MISIKKEDLLAFRKLQAEVIQTLKNASASFKDGTGVLLTQDAEALEQALAALPGLDWDLTLAQLKAKYHGPAQHPEFTQETWKQEVVSDGTKRGYWDWVVAQLEEQAND